MNNTFMVGVYANTRIITAFKKQEIIWTFSFCKKKGKTNGKARKSEIIVAVTNEIIWKLFLSFLEYYGINILQVFLFIFVLFSSYYIITVYTDSI